MFTIFSESKDKDDKNMIMTYPRLPEAVPHRFNIILNIAYLTQIHRISTYTSL